MQPPKTRIKFCGCTDLRDAALAVECGADAIGMIFAPSPRRIGLDAAAEIARELPAFVMPVGVFVNPTRDEVARVRDLFPDLAVQLHGEESAQFAASLGGTVIKTIHVAPGAESSEAVEQAVNVYADAVVLFDSAIAGVRGGTGVPFGWQAIVPVAQRRPVIVGGGLNPDNVASCVRQVRPFGVDVRSGIETDGRKDPGKMRAFVRAVQDADAA